MVEFAHLYELSLQIFTVGPDFKGIKMIPPGIHFVFYSSSTRFKSLNGFCAFFVYICSITGRFSLFLFPGMVKSFHLPSASLLMLVLLRFGIRLSSTTFNILCSSFVIFWSHIHADLRWLLQCNISFFSCFWLGNPLLFFSFH